MMAVTSTVIVDMYMCTTIAAATLHTGMSPCGHDVRVYGPGSVVDEEWLMWFTLLLPLPAALGLTGKVVDHTRHQCLFGKAVCPIDPRKLIMPIVPAEHQSHVVTSQGKVTVNQHYVTSCQTGIAPGSLRCEMAKHFRWHGHASTSSAQVMQVTCTGCLRAGTSMK
jgi:hypothetical protein